MSSPPFRSHFHESHEFNRSHNPGESLKDAERTFIMAANGFGKRAISALGAAVILFAAGCHGDYSLTAPKRLPFDPRPDYDLVENPDGDGYHCVRRHPLFENDDFEVRLSVGTTTLPGGERASTIGFPIYPKK